jgi:ABC-2 type transport system permease protein
VNHAPADILGTFAPQSAGKGSVLSALAALFGLALRQHLRGRRLIVLCFLFLLPSVLAVIIKLSPHAPTPGELEFALVLNLLPSALATLTALLYAAGMVRDEVEEQTLTYLLLTGAFTGLTMVVIYWDAPDQWRAALLERTPRTVALLAVAQAGYCSLFGVISLLTRWALVTGIGYIVIFEGLLANIDLLTRHLTVMYYFRVLAMRWFDPPESKEWSIDLATAPSARNCLLTLLTVSLVLMLFGAWRMVRSEFRMKTPEGS